MPTMVDGNDQKELNPGELHERELTGGQGSRTAASPTKKSDDDAIAGMEQGFYKSAKHPLGKGEKDAYGAKKVATNGLGSFLQKHKKELLISAGVSGGLIGIVTIFLLLLLLVAPYKNVHFATILRTVGLARFTYVMNKQFARVTFDAAVLSEESTGSIKNLPKDGLLYKAIGISPQKQLAQLGNDGVLKFQTEGKPILGGTLGKKTVFKGVVVNGESFSLDAVAQGYYKKDYADLTKGQARKVRSNFGTLVESKLSDALTLKSRRFRWGVYKGFYQVTGIRLIKWLNRAKDYVGLSDKQARVKNVEDTIKQVDKDGLGAKKSGLSEIDEPAAQEAANIEQAAKDGSTPGKVRSKLSDRVRGVRGLSTVVMAVTLACVVHSVAAAFNDSGQGREEQAARAASEPQTAMDQTIAGVGGSQVVGNAVGAENAMWGDSAQTAVLYKEAVGQPTNDAASQAQLASIPSIAAPQQRYAGLIHASDLILGGGIVGKIPGLGQISDTVGNVGCSVLLNEYVQDGEALAEIVFAIATAGQSEGAAAALQAGVKAGLTVVGSVGIGELLGRFIDSVIQSFSNTDFSQMELGADRFNTDYVATDYLGQVGNRQITFGRPIDAAETGAAQQQAMADLRAQNSQASFTQRYFAVDNPFSLTGTLAATLPTSATGMVNSMQQGIASLVSIIGSPQRLFSSVASIFTSRNHAFAGANLVRGDRFGIDSWGWSVAELNKVDSDDSFDLKELSKSVEPRLNELNNKYGACYASGYVLQADEPADCKKPGFLSSDEALHWRVYMADTYAAVHLTGAV